MRPVLAILVLVTGGCSQTPPAVNSNQRFQGEPSVVSRELTNDEQQAAVAAIASAQPPSQPSRPLAAAGPAGRWREVPAVAVAAAKRCEVAVVRSRAVAGGTAFDLRSIADQPGEMRVMGDEAHGVTGVTVTMGVFGEQQSLADCVRDSFEHELRRASAIARPQ